MKAKIIDVLKGLGLSEGQSKVYVALLELGATTAGAISKKTGMYRANVHLAIMQLIRKGLVSHLKKHREIIYKPTHPRYLFSILQKKRDELTSVFGELQKNYSKKRKERYEVGMLEGYDGMAAAFDEIKKKGTVVYASGGELRSTRDLPQ